MGSAAEQTLPMVDERGWLTAYLCVKGIVILLMRQGVHWLRIIGGAARDVSLVPTFESKSV